MENRERDRVSQRTEPTEAGQINRQTSESAGRESNSGTSAEFGQSIGRSENLSEGGEMRNRNQDELSNTDRSNMESGRRSGSGSLGSSSGRSSGSMGNKGSVDNSSDISSDRSSDRSSRRESSNELGSTGSSEGRH